MTGDDENPDSDSQMLRCGEFYPARDDTNELLPAGVKAGGRCIECGGDEFEPVILDPDRKHD